MNKKTVFLILAVLLVAAKFGVGLLEQGDTADSRPAPSAGTNAPAPVDSPPAVDDGVLRVVPDATVLNYGRVHSSGPVDLGRTIDRIRAGERHSHRNDGSVFGNRERLLPRRERGYYREYVHPTDGIGGPGPQRIVVGRDGDWWYTPDHYESFIPLGQEKRR